MSDTAAITVDEEERDALLGTGGTGVMSFPGPAEDSPHAVPISYGYDGADSTFYFRLAAGQDSDKGDLTDRPVTFVTHDRQDGTWWSVVAKGRLEGTTEASVATESLAGLQNVQIPLVDIFGRPVSDIPFEFYRLVPEELTARKESSTAP